MSSVCAGSLHEGDEIAEINGQSVANQSVDQLQKILVRLRDCNDHLEAPMFVPFRWLLFSLGLCTITRTHRKENIYIHLFCLTLSLDNLLSKLQGQK